MRYQMIKSIYCQHSYTMNEQSCIQRKYNNNKLFGKLRGKGNYVHGTKKNEKLNFMGQ